ncbi:MAG TPA: glycosyltransferase family 9 protein [Anaerolineae bacterium]
MIAAAVQHPAGAGRTTAQRLRLAGLRLAGRAYPRDRGRQRGSDTQPRSILLIRPDHLGDLLFLTPALHALRLALPSAHLTLLAGPWGAEAVRGNPDLDELRLCRFPGFARTTQKPGLAPYRLLASTAAELSAERYDVALVLRFDHWWGAWLAAAAGIPRRLGYDLPETRPFLTEPISYGAGRHEVEQNLTLVRTLAPAADRLAGPLRYIVRTEERDWASGWLSAQGIDLGRPLIAIHPGAGAAVKQWPAAAWAAVADDLSAAYSAQVVLTGGPAELSLTQAVAAAMTRRAVDAAGQTSLGQLAALYARCRLALGADSGPLHLAVAAGAATVHLYGPVPAAKFGPWGDPSRHRVVVSPWQCVPCDRLAWPASQLAFHRCMAAISTAKVLAAAHQVLDLNYTD